MIEVPHYETAWSEECGCQLMTKDGVPELCVCFDHLIELHNLSSDE